jgi:hypothetical protein
LHFEEAFGRAETEIEQGLRMHQRVFEHYHRAFVGNSPYNLYNRLNGRRVVIVAVLYARFSPERISKALRKRGPWWSLLPIGAPIEAGNYARRWCQWLGSRLKGETAMTQT